MELGFGPIAVALVVVLLVVLAFRKSSWSAAIGLGIALVLLSGFLLNTLILDEPYIEKDLNSNLDSAALIGGSAVIGIALGVFGFLKRPKTRA
ncbi:hypothetical protein [Actinoplanes derwentensis]|uniref:Uncharacterized protein n=1 Tax=Actinoplanes derwentensis TaxID=113562 RepID=A0A1H1TQB2_9ACTN|nr:hypothetical protein [Actinoplanes derwentensis]GID85084.1 hypothetical protein Ade03nite_40080 [Actinoplanes derwentensis]SDS61749.1 hypothetical protein SAMN04489716_1191 [Actinoplanes derwentensis]